MGECAYIIHASCAFDFSHSTRYASWLLVVKRETEERDGGKRCVGFRPNDAAYICTKLLHTTLVSLLKKKR